MTDWPSEFSHACHSMLLRPLTWRVTSQQLWHRWGNSAESTRISGLLLSVRNCHASVKMATLSLFFCAPRARIKILTSSKFRTEKIFVVYFRVLKFYAKYAKFCTVRKFPAIRYSMAATIWRRLLKYETFKIWYKIWVVFIFNFSNRQVFAVQWNLAITVEV